MYQNFSGHELSLYELSVVFLVKNQNPTLLNWDFLKYSGIVPQDWRLDSNPVYTQQGSQLIFENGLQIASDNSRTIFLENIIGKSIDNIVAAQIAQLYTQVLPYVEYEGLGINLTGVVSFREQPQLAQTYLAKNLFAGGNWLEFGIQPPKVDVNISYTLEQGNLNMQISQIELPQENQEAKMPAIRYFGNFDYGLQQVPITERLGRLQSVLVQWQAHIEMFTSLINERFMNENNLSFPGGNQNLTGEPIEQF
ncbi:MULTISPECIES: hypothetical protein [unclassified Anabaena]|uniref:hypothetical protein n=1 Tax=unclassified Anabaena TaxID=2619674 RepID=UPI0008328FD4|nr:MULTISPECIES: hypothetical protein [unclassified Anabaena]